MIAFHGFGQDGSAFEPLAEAFPEFTFCSIDLPFHGKTVILNPDNPLTATEIVELISGLKKAMGFERFSITGFSLGARIACSVLHHFASEIDTALLIAPDGITESFWYWLATHDKPSRKVFYYVLNNPWILSGIINAGKKTGLIDKKTAKLVSTSLKTHEKSMQIYYSWTYFRKLKSDCNTLAYKLNRHGIGIKFIMARYDRVIPLKFIKPLTEKLDNPEVLILQCGHYDLINQFATFLKAPLNTAGQ